MLGNKVYSSVIILSLTAAFTCTALFMSFLISETDTDSFHTKKDRIVQVMSTDPFDKEKMTAYVLPGFSDFVSKFGEVEDKCHMSLIGNVNVVIDGDRHKIPVVVAADQSFFNLFNFSTTSPDNKQLLGTNRVVLSEERALALFGSTDVIGNLLEITDSDSTTMMMEISAIIKKSGHNSHLRFDMLIDRDAIDRFNGGAVYLQLNSSAGRDELLAKINADSLRPSLLGPAKADYKFVPLTDAYFNTENKLPYTKYRSRTFLMVGYVACALVLSIAAFNFVNLVLLFWQKRQRSIGIRKTLGVSRSYFWRFSTTESLLYLAIAFPLSLAVILAVLPLVNTTFDGNIDIRYLLNTKVLVTIAGVATLVVVVVATITALKQQSVKAMLQLNGNAKGYKANDTLFVTQFLVSASLVIAAVTVTMQMRYLESAPLGFNRHIVQIDNPGSAQRSLMPALKEAVLQIANVDHAALSSGNPISANMIARYDLPDNSFYTPYLFNGDDDLFKTLGLNLIEGELPTHNRQGKVVNETLVRQFQMTNPVGSKLPGSEDLIIGVVSDFTCSSFKNEIPPVVISFSGDASSLLVSYAGKNDQNLSRLLPQLELAWDGIFPDETFRYKIIQDDLMNKYKDDRFLYRIVFTMAVITIALSCFGLFALSWAVTQGRSKEMSIRKVFGASIADVLALLTVAFSRRILIAFLIAAPVSYYFMNQWLATFANKISIDGWIFAIALAIVAIIAALTLSVQTLRAARANPVDEIRNS